MRIPITKYGLPQVLIFPVLTAALMLAGGVFLPAPLPLILLFEFPLLVIFIWVLAFFRDPLRSPPHDPGLLLSPADGTVTDIQIAQEDTFLAGEALKIGIFLSIFDVHINRAPCGVRIERITYKKGRYLDARDPESGRVNESNDLALIRVDDPKNKLLVRQISGAIARRIVCEANVGQQLRPGQKFGMIKFGSRTELYLPAEARAKCLVKIGDKVKAGLTPMVRYESDAPGAQTRSPAGIVR
jgi:phosphatidylserine decarboxylase